MIFESEAGPDTKLPSLRFERKPSVALISGFARGVQEEEVVSSPGYIVSEREVRLYVAADEEGRFSFHGLPRRALKVYARPWRSAGLESQALVAPDQEDVELRLTR